MEQFYGPSLPTKDLSFHLSCKECRSPTEIIEDYREGCLICSACGLVVCSTLIDTRPEWRTFSDSTGADMHRVGSAQNNNLRSNNVEITVVGGSSSSLQKLQLRLHDSKDNALFSVFKNIDELTAKMGLTTLIGDTVKEIYRSAYLAKMIRQAKSSNAAIAACVLMSCRQHHVARSFKEISQFSKVNIKDISRAHDLFKSLYPTTSSTELESCTDHIASFMSRSCHQLAVSYSLIRQATEFATRVTQLGIFDGRSPVTISASCLFFTLLVQGEKRSIAQVSQAAKCGQPTLRDAYRKLYSLRHSLTSTPQFLIDL